MSPAAPLSPHCAGPELRAELKAGLVAATHGRVAIPPHAAAGALAAENGLVKTHRAESHVPRNVRTSLRATRAAFPVTPPPLPDKAETRDVDLGDFSKSSSRSWAPRPLWLPSKPGCSVPVTQDSHAVKTLEVTAAAAPRHLSQFTVTFRHCFVTFLLLLWPGLKKQRHPGGPTQLSCWGQGTDGPSWAS